MVEHVCVFWWVDTSLDAKARAGGVQTFANGL
jgi:hypothetical protein